jgi:hypothetical protein
MSKKFLLTKKFRESDAQNILNKYSLRLHSSSRLFSKCLVANCFNTDIEIHYVTKLGRCVKRDKKVVVLTSNNKFITGISAISSVVNCKQIPLCSFHHLEFEIGHYSLLDYDLINNIYHVDCSHINFEEVFLGK